MTTDITKNQFMYQ